MKIYDIKEPTSDVKIYKTDTKLLIFIAKEMGKWHLSVSHFDRNPTWEEIKEIRYKLLPRDRTFAMLLPPEDQYVNIHEYCFHLWEVEN